MLFLTVSFHASPYFTGADIVFFFAWMPFIVSGGGTRLSRRCVHRPTRRAKARSTLAPTGARFPFATVQAICGNYDEGTCAARGGLACDRPYVRCCSAVGEPSSTRRAWTSSTVARVVVGAGVAAGAAAGVLILGGAAADIGKLINDAPKPGKRNELTLSTTAPPTTTTAPQGSGTGDGTTTTTTTRSGGQTARRGLRGARESCRREFHDSLQR